MGCFNWFRFKTRTTLPPQVPVMQAKSPLTSSSASSARVSTTRNSPDGPSTCFTCTRLNSSTFRIVEADKYDELPFIYVKVYDSVIVLIDTGCGGAAKDPGVELTSLRDFIETYPLEDSHGKPLNPGGSRSYAVICTHCHYDHIGAVAQFTDTPRSSIWASAYDKGFIEDDLPTSSLCRFVGMETPNYTVTNWAANAQRVAFGSKDLGLTIYQTPGHTPDELAVWDQQERVLYVGDTLYEWAPILFSLSGNLSDYASTLQTLIGLVDGWNKDAVEGDRVKMACGHCTSNTAAAEFLYEVDGFLSKIRRGLVSPIDKGTTPGRNVPLVGFEREDGWFSFLMGILPMTPQPRTLLV
ncbi:hypothetical protein diail_8232 [Diaporthe ilicicola]|nr:hypothetical protein diail_8232 [Diaporthe ilicicola]